MNAKSKWASTIFSVSALGATILLSAPVKANCFTSESVTATAINTWTYGADYCNTEPGNGAAYLQYAVAYANNGSTGYSVNYTYSWSNFGGTHAYRDYACVTCANVGPQQCDPMWISGWQTVSGGPGQFPPSSSAGCPLGDGATGAQGYVWVQ